MMDIGQLIMDGPILLNIKENGVATITLNRPEVFNALNEETADAFNLALEEIEKRDDVKVIVWTGKGEALSGGGDIRMLKSLDKVSEARRIFERAYIQNKRFYDLPVPVIVAANGVIAGVATGRTLAADIIIASEKAKFAANFINIGLLPDGGTSYFLFKKLGHQRTAEILYNGKVLNTKECLELGIFNQVVSHQDLYPTVYAMADKLATGPSVALKYSKQILRSCANNDFAAIASMEAGGQVQCWSTHDFHEGVAAFLEKRKAVFKGC
jgi:2-(1,2-epoxy-1,2-dihydrophenyl)acetyl-CoA isomerase